MTKTDTAGGEEQGINDPLLAEIEYLSTKLAAVRERISRVIFGQQNVIDEALIVLFAGRHALLGGVPDLAKTRLVKTLGTVLGLSEKRVQFTPDVMPADIIGSEVSDESHILQPQAGRFARHRVATKPLVTWTGRPFPRSFQSHRKICATVHTGEYADVLRG